MDADGFYKITLPAKQNLFKSLMGSADFETTGKGRLGNHLVKENHGNIAVVRTTTRYSIPANLFSDVHCSVIAEINKIISATDTALPEQNFNNALIEVYDLSYSKMGFHSDQALDLEDDSFVALFSCYENPDVLKENQLRKLVIKNKTTGEESEITLDHHSAVLFSAETNKKFQHKIILHPKQDSKNYTDNRWLGITFRTSRTFITFKDTQPYFSTGELLTLADEKQEKEFFQLRGNENRSLDFTYPKLFYTINPADLLIPQNKNKP
ncbi:alpha-ketoglutarate-dependent dioxygenase AlkB [uncultured Chryseobacterium sp.]|uniref:alpha-ketoglutarate-dependent dioxygenase AlkB n=1 Tax=uncultured Chryseobacterium sp. TaxID=259322 RepID=UPI0025DF3240|nr:alpha-ketoglutarate-dependent dioxygenase AlkB [uncultured Chryseobacterium sp.]